MNKSSWETVLQKKEGRIGLKSEGVKSQELKRKAQGKKREEVLEP